MSNYTNSDHPQLPSLDLIGVSEAADKASCFHDYLRHYEPALCRYRDSPIRLMEMGVLGGNSMRMWARYFNHPSAVFVGLEPFEYGWVLTDSRMRWVKGRQEVPEDIYAAFRAAGSLPFDVIVDDAGHFPEPQKASFDLCWPFLADDGVYIIEDLHSAWMLNITPNPADSIMGWLYQLVDGLNDWGKGECGAQAPGSLRESIKEIRFVKSACLIFKQAIASV